MVRPNQPLHYPSLPCIIQCRTDKLDTPISVQEFEPVELCRLAGYLQADYEALSTRGTLVDRTVLPGYLFYFEEMTKGDNLSVLVFPDKLPIHPDNMVLSFCVVLQHNFIHRELMEYAEKTPEYGYKFPPEPPYCSITPQSLYDAHQNRLEEIMTVVRGYSFIMWRAFLTTRT